jgi:hypothetical protein
MVLLIYYWTASWKPIYTGLKLDLTPLAYMQGRAPPSNPHERAKATITMPVRIHHKPLFIG